ncbi:10326_t:CDS:2 [Rhizophagus irregularis]|nr:10326_t:CDS:2 [Rhizophagus irregularis]
MDCERRFSNDLRNSLNNETLHFLNNSWSGRKKDLSEFDFARALQIWSREKLSAADPNMSD